jgi:hypothetical protein
MTARRRQAEQNLKELRELWEAERDLTYLWQALNWARGSPLPIWLTDALTENLQTATVSPRQRQQGTLQDQRGRIVNAVRDAIHGSRPYPFFYADADETASEAHFRVAAERLTAEGLKCTPDSVKKTWQRHKPLSYDEVLARITDDSN